MEFFRQGAFRFIDDDDFAFIPDDEGSVIYSVSRGLSRAR